MPIMPVLKRSDNKLFLGIGNKLLIAIETTGKTSIIDLPAINIPENPSKAQLDLFQETPDIKSIAISKDDCFLAITTHNRQVVIYKLNDLSVNANFVINRAASKICFDLENNVIVADKTGDAYVYKNGQEESLLLGHLSMLLDVAITPCGKFLITSDRDEKIRVSHYPNCYNILCFCLGHSEFVTNVAVVNNQLLTTSGDGTIRLWDYKSGKEILQIDTNKNLKDSSQITAFKESMNKENIEAIAIPVMNMQVYQHREDCALIGVTLFGVDSIELYEFNFKGKIYLLQSIKIHSANSSKVITYCLGQVLIVLLDDKFVFYNFDKNCYKLDSKEILINNQEILRQIEMKTDVALLYKRKFDNVQEYLERKKQRLEAK